MRIKRSSLEKHIEKLNLALSENSFYTPVLLNSKTIIFPNKEKRNQYLVISMNKNNPLIYETMDGNFYLSFEDSSFLIFKKLVSEITIKDIELSDEDNVVIIHANKNASEDFEEITIFFEMFSHRPNIRIGDFSYYQYEGELKPVEISEVGNEINEDFIRSHFENELIIRKKEKYHNFITYLNSKMKGINRKMDAIQNDVKEAELNLDLKDKADAMFTLGLDMKKHYQEVDIYGEKVKLDEALTLIDNIQAFYKKSHKAKVAIERSNENLENARKEYEIYRVFKERFDEAKTEKEINHIIAESGMIKKKKETKETIFNRPYKINLNGTIFYFGRNASQNDYLSFVMKNNRDFYWFHIKDIPGAHIVLCNVKPTENEIIFASEIALIASKVTTAEVTYTKKKNVKRGHKLGEAIIKNYSTIKLNSVREESKILFEKATKL